jgi:hypothetical protein
MGFLDGLLSIFAKRQNLLDTKTIQNIAIEIAMFQNWHLENGPYDLKADEIEMISKKILARENLTFNANDIFLIKSCAYSFSYGEINRFRKNTKFDETVMQFCKSIELDDKYFLFK